MKEISNNNSIINRKKPLNIAIIGAGFMGSAIAKGLLNSFSNINLTVSEINSDKIDLIKSNLNVKVSSNNADTVKNSQIIFLAVKPNILPSVLEEIGPYCTKNKIIISIAAGINLETIENYISKSPVIRVMPNICAQVEEGAIAYALGHNVSLEQKEIVHKLLSSMGQCMCVEENMMDAVTGLSGSAPAYIFMAIEALSDGGVLCGLPRNIANELAAQTVYGAAKMYMENNFHAGVLKDMVTSPGGTTIKGVQALEENSFRASLIKAVEEAYKQSKKFSENK